MIQIYIFIENLNKHLSKLQESLKIVDYRIYLKSNNTITAYIISDDLNISEILKDKFQNDNLDFEVLYTEEEDSFIKDLYFSGKQKINTSLSDKSLVSLLEEDYEIPRSSNFPIATFYSYKGGVGRSTTLAACASYLSIHYAKKVVVIDCDFEAPGFTNFFLNDPGIPFYNNGLIEYLLDKEFTNQELNLRNYLWEASKEFSGKGEIYVMPAGNLNDGDFETNIAKDKTHYLKGLARINFSEKPYMIEKFRELLSSIEKEINPDIVLLDSRTGFNDVFGLTAFQLSNIVVGFFGSNVQTLPGINFFIDSIIKRKNLTGLVVNSIIPAANRRKWFKNFRDYLDNYIASVSDSSTELQNEINTDQIIIDAFPVSRQEILESLGTKEEDKLDFIDFITSKTFPDYVDLFEKINSLSNDIKAQPEQIYQSTDSSFDVRIKESPIDLDIVKDVSKNISEEIEEVSDEEINFTNIRETPLSSTFTLKKQVLSALKEKMPELYAEDIPDFEEEYNSGRYFYRKSMLDIFNLDKFIILGNKGTGKTYIYRSLNNRKIVTELKARANKTNLDYQFIQLIFKGKYFIDTTKFDGREIFSMEKYYERFWQVYIWNVLTNELKGHLNYMPQLACFPIADNTETSVKFHDIICSDDSIIKIEKDLEIIDSLLKDQGDKHIIVIFDELDHVVKPQMWSDRVAPLINLCKKFTYSRIYPKLFLRSDLFEKISNVNNIQALNNRSIKIEWDREELFAYFFKVVISHSKEDFFELMRQYRRYPSFHINKIRKEIDLHGKQPPLDEYVLRHLTATFFGKYADVHNTSRYGESYDWFFKNLKNANDTISLRPFIDLISEAVKWAISEDKTEEPILPQYYYSHGKAREHAVERHFNDLAREKGNGDLIFIFNYLKDDANSKFKTLELHQKDFHELLDLIIDRYPDIENKSKESLIELLKVNGIIADRIVRLGHNRSIQKRYQFALLYKYYLGLKNRIR